MFHLAFDNNYKYSGSPRLTILQMSTKPFLSMKRSSLSQCLCVTTLPPPPPTGSIPLYFLKHKNAHKHIHVPLTYHLVVQVCYKVF